MTAQISFEQWQAQAIVAMQGRPDADVILDQMIEDPALWPAFLSYLETGQVDPSTQGSFTTWPEGTGMPNPTLGELMAGGLDPLAAFLHLAALARQVNERIEELVTRYESCELVCEFGSVW